MTIAGFAPADRAGRATGLRGVNAVVAWIVARRHARARRNALQDLLFAPEPRLRDIGITREEVIRAIETHGR